MNTTVRVFVQNEAGSRIKNRHNEKTLEYLGSIALNEPYPFPYGFVLETTTDDGDNVDCYIFTEKKLSAESIVECYAMGLLELFENGETDHKVVAVLPEEQFEAIDEALDLIRRFYEGISGQFPNIVFKVGEFLPVELAIEYIERYSESRDSTP